MWTQQGIAGRSEGYKGPIGTINAVSNGGGEREDGRFVTGRRILSSYLFFLCGEDAPGESAQWRNSG